MIRTKSSTKAMPDGPLESMFPVANSKTLDFLSTHKRWDYSVSDIAKYSGVSFKTALAVVKKLEAQGIIKQTRTVGNAIMYQFDMESKQAYYIDKLINEIATRRIKETMRSAQNTLMKVKPRRKNKIKTS